MEAAVQQRREREEQEEEEEVGSMDLKTRRRAHSHHNQASPRTSENSSITSESSDSSNLEDFLGDKNDNNGTSNNGVVNGGEVEVFEGGSVEKEAESEAQNQKEAIFEEEEVFFSSNEGISRISVYQNGDSTNGSSLSKSPDIGVGLKDFESLLDEGSNNLNFAATDVYNALEDTLNNTPKNVENESFHPGLSKGPITEVEEIDVEKVIQKHVFTLNDAPTSVENESGNLGLKKEPSPEIEEFDVERVIQKQETHEFFCPNCNSCITKRVILKRRKRKVDEISTSEDTGSSSTPAQTAPPLTGGNFQEIQEKIPAPPVDKGSEERICAITCLSCFSIFLPSRDGWLGRIFARKPEVPAEPVGPLTEPLVPTHGGADVGEVSADVNADYVKGNAFPFWIVNCCQPSIDGNRPSPPEATAPPNPEPAPEQLGHGHPGRPSEDPEDLGATKPGTAPSLTLPDGLESSKDKTKPDLSVADETRFPSKPEPSPKPGKGQLEVILPAKPPLQGPQHPEIPNGKPMSPEPKIESEHMFALWFVNCCQPNRDGVIPPKKQDPLLPPGSKPVPGVDPSLPPGSEPGSKPAPGVYPSLPPGSEPGSKPAPGVNPSLPPGSEPAPEPAPGVGPDLPHDSKLDEDPSLPPGSEPGFKPAPGFYPSLPSGSEPGSKPAPGVNPSLPPGSEPVPGIGPDLPHDSKLDEGTTGPPKPKPKPGPGKPLPIEPIPPPTNNEIVSLPDSKHPAAIDTGEKETIIPPDEAAFKPPSPAPIPGGIPSGPGTLVDPEDPLLGSSRPREGAGVEIIKATVYGGLLESITSLSVIASAAGGDATTLNIVALGLANVFGGLVLLFHNLRVLKHDHGTERYIQQLGEPGHFLLHATIAVISYLVFGLMAPIIYGFSFRKSDNKDFKLATLAAASLVCITVLSTAKAYVRRPPREYIQTIFYYISLGFMVSGLGYVAGDLINMLLKKLGVFDSREAGDVKALWASY